MIDWSVSRKLDEVIEQNKEIINLMKMQMIAANPDVDFYELNNKVRIAVHEAQAKEHADREKQEQEKRIRIINKHNQISGSTPWRPSYGEND